VEDATSFIIKYRIRFSPSIQVSVHHLCGLHDVDPSSWYAFRNVKEWWMDAIHKQGQSKKVMTSLGMLVSWEIWKEKNASTFSETPPLLRLWSSTKSKK
jgi:hypothetical protein